MWEDHLVARPKPCEVRPIPKLLVQDHDCFSYQTNHFCIRPRLLYLIKLLTSLDRAKLLIFKKSLLEFEILQAGNLKACNKSF